MSLIEGLAREYTLLSSVGRTFYRMRRALKADASYTISDILEEQARTIPNNTAVLFEDRCITYAELSRGANRYASWAMSQGIKRGDAVALLMSNRPEYLMAWLGIVKFGGVVALLNTNLRGESLAHCMDVAKCRHAIIGGELTDSFRSALPHLHSRPVPWATGAKTPGTEDLDAALAQQSGYAVDPFVREGLTTKDNAFFIYTSGTTGLPKAANFSHTRMLFMMFGFAGALGATARDRMYDVLPLYHSTGGVCAVGVALTSGGSLVLRRKFSAQEFWTDCSKYRPTFFQYIGELCRYLLNTPPSEHEREHCLRAITGNGLSPDIWSAFQERFSIPKIMEFYGATEGNVSMINYDGKLGAVGRVPPYMRKLFPTAIVRFDPETEKAQRGPDGFCRECAPDEVGEAIGKIRNAPGRGFEGYTSVGDTDKKILRNVFEAGDAWFRTGDLMRRDRQGYFYFVDRVGDTFRWKGENVSTTEVAGALTNIDGISEANVYGVAVPGQSGRAGMAALVVDEAFDVVTLASELANRLPSYAQPLFVRLRQTLEVTGTFKLRKVELVKDGFNPTVIAEPLYWLNSAAGRYEALDAARYDDIITGRVRI